MRGTIKKFRDEITKAKAEIAEQEDKERKEAGGKLVRKPPNTEGLEKAKEAVAAIKGKIKGLVSQLFCCGGDSDGGKTQKNHRIGDNSSL